MSQRIAFCSIAAQPDNLGDIAIRQAVVDLIQTAGCPMVIYTGAMPTSYLRAFRVPESAQIVASQRRFLATFVRACFRRRAHLFFAPGPFAARGGTNILRSIASLANVIAVRASGGHAITLGRAIRGSNAFDLAITRMSIRAMSLFVSRDVLTEEIVRLPVETAPDLALSGVTESGTTARRSVVISLRGDREPNHQLLQQVVAEARANDLVPVFVTQVKRDDAGHTALAAQYGAELCGWTDQSHSEQLERIESVYATAHTVFSDRLHAIIFGLRNFAYPIALRHSGADKVTPTLAHLVNLRTQASSASQLDDPLVQLDEDRRGELAIDVLKASATLDSLFARVGAMISTRSDQGDEQPRGRK